MGHKPSYVPPGAGRRPLQPICIMPHQARRRFPAVHASNPILLCVACPRGEGWTPTCGVLLSAPARAITVLHETGNGSVKNSIHSAACSGGCSCSRFLSGVSPIKLAPSYVNCCDLSMTKRTEHKYLTENRKLIVGRASSSIFLQRLSRFSDLYSNYVNEPYI